MTGADVLLSYQTHILELQAALAAVHSRQWLTLGIGVAALALTFALAISRRLPYSPLPLPIVALCARRYGRQQSRRSTLSRLRAYYECGVARLQDQWAGHGESGEEYERPGHLYARDLNLFGRGSLFERLCQARTEIGKRKLAANLQDPCPPIGEILARQAAVAELRDNTTLREQLATLGEAYQQAEAGTFDDWLERPVRPFPVYLRILAALTSLIAAVALCLSIGGQLSLPILFAVLAIQAAIAWALRPRVAPIIQNSRLLAVELNLVCDGVSLLARQSFHSPKLRALTAATRPAPRHLRRLAFLLRLLTERNKEHFYLPASVVLLGTQTAMAIEGWRARHSGEMAAWLHAWAEFETLNAFACYAYENPEDPFPSLESGAPVFEADALGHPMLPRATCVRNSLRLPQLLLLSGSNMAGKSTLLRAIGVNAVLAFAGAPVRAANLRLSAFSLVASLSIQDALADGKSRFLAEVERLRHALHLAAASPPLLFLIDEIFSGTNSTDRRIAAEAVAVALSNAGALGAISTHDLALTAIPNATNAHMCARSDSDPLAFDYLLKPGINAQSNALAIARLAGVPI
ncbi:MAG: DNA mismatch repair protein MutS [Bryobacterales bacterium]|nr:DNA mismatch repair protein MutS [Bryobacterales bacterium]